MPERILAIGDIHGQWDKFLSLYHKISFRPDKDLLVFLGDYIDRGPKSPQMLDWLYEHRQEKSIVMLRGNHEQMMLNYYRVQPTDNMHLWLWNGGDATRRALRKQAPELQRKCLAFVAGLPLSYQIEAGGKSFFFCHAGVDPAKPPAQQEADSLLWIREEYYCHYQGKTVIVSGHTPVGQIEPGRKTPLIKTNMILMDTGSFLPGGRVSCLDVLSGELWQDVDQK